MRTNILLMAETPVRSRRCSNRGWSRGGSVHREPAEGDDPDIVIDGGGKVTLSGGGQVRIL